MQATQQLAEISDYLGVKCVCQHCGKEWISRTSHRPFQCAAACRRSWFWWMDPEDAPPPRKRKTKKRKK
jgi:hypothetical protein